MHTTNSTSRIAHALLLSLALGALGCSSDDSQNNPQPDAALDSAPCDPQQDPRCQGAALPTFQLQDFQPQSSRVGQTYGLDEFKGKVLLVALLAAW